MRTNIPAGCWFFVALGLIVSLAGCRSSDSQPPPSEEQSVSGNDPNTPPPANAAQTLVQLINQNSRAPNNLSSLTNSAAANKVAQDTSDNWANTGKRTTVVNGQDVNERLEAAGFSLTSGVATAVIFADGFSSPQLLYNAMVADPNVNNTLLDSGYTRIGVGISKPGSGNLWVIILF